MTPVIHCSIAFTTLLITGFCDSSHYSWVITFWSALHSAYGLVIVNGFEKNYL